MAGPHAQPETPCGSYFAHADAAREAIDLALPMIEAALQDKEVSGLSVLYIVVMDPGLGPRDTSFETAVLLEHAVGDRSSWDADYAAFARAKARLSWETGLNGSVVQAHRVHGLRQGDSLLWGGVCLDGIVVGVSGAHPWYDEAFATAIAANLRALAKRRHAEALKTQHTASGNAALPASAS